MAAPRSDSNLAAHGVNGSSTTARGVCRADALAQVERLLASAEFRGSKRCGSFLRFVAERALREPVEPLKERVLGVEVFGRPADYDTNEDPVVRNAAGEVRKRLAQYYQETGREAEVRVELPLGSYLPVFTAPVAASPAPPPARKRTLPRRWRWMVAALVVVVLLAAAGLTVRVWPQDPLQTFWEPLFNSQGPVLVCIGQTKAFNFVPETEYRFDEHFDQPEWFKQHGTETVPLRDIVIYPKRYTPLLDAISLTRITSVLAVAGKSYRVRGTLSTSFTDLRENPAVLIGAFSNDWTLAVNSKSRYVFTSDSSIQEFSIRDREDPNRRKWSVVRPWPEWNVPEDYAIVSRTLDPDTGRIVIAAAGITEFGTAAAAEFVTNPTYLGTLLKQAPRGMKWQNAEVVLSTRVVGHVAGPPRILVSHFW